MNNKKISKKPEFKSETKIEFEAEPKSTTSQTISEININLLMAAAPSTDEYLEDYNHCPLCGTELIYTHVTQFINSQVTEEAHCEKCNICTKNNQHSLH